MTEWAATDPDEIIDRLGEANEALIAKVRQANRATAAARTNERYYRALFEAIDEAFSVVEVLFDEHEHPYDYRFIQVNAAFQWHSGLAAVHGRTMRELRPKHEQSWYDIYGRVARTGQPAHFTQHAEELDGRWFQVSAFALGETRPYHVGVLFRDITEERGDEERVRLMAQRHAFLLRLGDAVRSLEDAGEIRATATRLLREQLGLDRCGYGEIDEHEVVTISHDDRLADMPAMTGERRMADYDQGIMDVFRRGQTLVIDDVGTDTRTQSPEVQATCAQAQIGATLEAPLMRGDKLCAILFAQQREPRRWTAEEITLVQDVAERTWAMVEHARGGEVLRTSEARKAFLLELSDAVRPLQDAADISHATAATLGRYLGVGRSLYGEFDAESERFTVDRDWTDGTVEHLSGPLRASEFGEFALALLRGETVVVDDTRDDPRADSAADAFKRMGQIRSTVAVPLVTGGALTAAFAVQDTRPRHWTSDEVALIEEVADRTWASMQQAHATAALEETQRRAELAAEAAEMGSFVWYPEEDWSVCDARLMRMYGLDADAELNLEIALDGMHPDDRERYAAAALAAADPKGDGRLLEEYRMVRPDGEVRQYAVNARATFGATTRIYGVVTDLTDQRRAEQQAREEREDRERRDREFVANAAHELRTPLAGIIAAMDALEAGAADEPADRERFLGHIRGAADRMTRLSESLLLLAQPDGDVPTQPVGVLALLEEVASGVRPREGVEVAVEAADDLTVVTSPGLLERVVVNLAENAAAHTPRGRIELRGATLADGVDITVSNTGHRIDPEVAKRAFDRFYQGSDGSGGFGLGLSIAAQAAAAIGGELTLEPAPGSGTRARLRLPLVRPVSPS